MQYIPIKAFSLDQRHKVSLKAFQSLTSENPYRVLKKELRLTLKLFIFRFCILLRVLSRLLEEPSLARTLKGVYFIYMTASVV
jgi:hypothetical protein